MTNYLTGIMVGAATVLWLFFLASVAKADFRNQMTLMGNAGLTEQEYADYAAHWDYAQVLGDPWGTKKTKTAVQAGLGVSFNSSAGNGFKVWSVTGHGSITNPTEPTQVNKGNGPVPLTDQIYRDLERIACMTQYGAAMPYNKLYDTVAKRWKYEIYNGSNSSVQFQANRYTDAAVTMQVDATMELWAEQETAAGLPLFNGVFFDEIKFPIVTAPKCFNPGNPEIAKVGNIAAYDVGRKTFIREVVKRAKLKLGAAYAGTSGNPYGVDRYTPEQTDPAWPDNFLSLVSNESSGGTPCDTMTELVVDSATGCGTQNSTTYGVISPTNVQVQLGPTNATATPQWFEANCKAAQLIAGRAAWQGSWMGWFGAINVTYATACTQLMRAIPNWDNTVGVVDRQWNETTDTYTSSNAFFNSEISYARHPKTRKMFVVRHSGAPTIKLNPGEIMTKAECTNSLFKETATCMTGYFSQCGDEILLGANVVNGAGYILTIQPKQD